MAGAGRATWDALELVVVDERLGRRDGIVVGRNGDGAVNCRTRSPAVRGNAHPIPEQRRFTIEGDDREPDVERGQVAASAYLGDRFGSCRVQCRCPSGQHLVDERLIQVWCPSNRVFTTRTCARTSRMSGGLEHQQRRTPVVRIDEEWLDAHSDPYGRRFNVHQLRADPRSLIELHDCGYVQYLVVPCGATARRASVNV